MEPFSDLQPQLQGPLVARGFSTLTPVQQAVADADSVARDLRISSQTGSGKTVAVGIAIARELLQEGPREDGRAATVLALTPTRELAVQVRGELTWLLREIPDAQVQVVTGGTSVGLERRQLAQGPRIVVGTPGRVLDHLRSGGLVGTQIRLVVLDEADRMVDMGFREELEGILDLLPGRERMHLVSATFSGDVRQLAEGFQSNPLWIEGSPLGEANADISHVVHLVEGGQRYNALVNVLLLSAARHDGTQPGRTLVFVRTRADALELAERLQRDGVRAEPLSGDLAQTQRTRTLNAFRRGHVATLVATDVAARGLDVEDIELVVHFEPPMDADSLTHRSGRTGRAGRKGTSVLLVSHPARRRVERLLREAKVNPTFAPIPTQAKVQSAFRKLVRRKLHDLLQGELCTIHLDYAKKLLAEHPAERVLAALLTQAAIEPPCEPRDIQMEPVSPTAVFREQRFNHRGRWHRESEKLSPHVRTAGRWHGAAKRASSRPPRRSR